MTTNKYKGKYRNESTRLQNWNYAWDAAYFITICTQNREHYFGEIQNGKMNISAAGSIAFVLWYEIKNHAKNIEFGEFVVMPNHVHGILILDGNDGTTDTVGTTHALSLPPPSNDDKTIGNRRFQNQGKNTISSIIGSYKSGVTKYCNRLDLPFAWQTRFYDHIIRNEDAFHRISNYIMNNPSNWS